ncbi:hypothetical protein DFP72DRAFT_442351 [Ephemerocybe angulata]|uniref:Uncharacterized protein n=1 Tax=Ephemerocybe angulata TaxID=980116 RepID=A0A8H6HTD5_9AGAR|nr:hypothetical protein DFP72DRAFT_442351 [Tulosesus angulatus]
MRSSVSQHFRTPSSTSSKMEKPIRPDSPILTHAPQRLAQGLRARASVSHFPASPPVRRSDERIGAPGVGRAESPAQPPYVRRVAQGVRARASVSHFPTPRGVGDRLGGAGPLVSSSRPASPAQPISMISQGLRTRASVPCLPQPSTMGHGHTPTLVRFSSQPPAPQSLIPVPKSRLGAAGSGAGQQGYAAGKQQIGMVQHGASVCLNVAPPPIDDPEVVPANGKRERRVSFKSLSAARRASSVQLGVSYRMGGGVGEGGIGSSPISGAKALGSPLFARGEKRERVASYLKGAGQRLGGILRFDGRGDAEREKGNLNGKGDSGIGEKELKKSSVPALGGVRAGLGLGSTARVDRPRR